MLNSLQIHSEYRKHLLLVDPFAAADPSIQTFAISLMSAGKSFELHVIDSENSELLPILNRQTMSTFLYIAGMTSVVDTLHSAAVSAGFTESEMQVIRFEAAGKRLFCAGCQNIFSITVETEAVCKGCGLRLSVTDHYSPNLTAYLGYPEIY